ncbi:hypothetical protein [Pseudomonas schmalbachii]|uniref:Uncharacterized protein n=1 Tax=Pseudomonas schmalbachii TaxID=2816993 RepID=A0ABS3TJ53_9PSED|nr:hypothetical protein [Pseudomonas schmalbachii]MBO3273681.1 hypothetical protein [Pseudomonas schmalbachii]
MENDNKRAVESLAKGLVELHAPEEIGYFEELKKQSSNDFLDDDDAFAFGVTEVVPAITPIAMMMASVAMNFVLEIMSEAGGDVLKEKYKNWIRGRFSENPEIADNLTPEQKETLIKALLSAASEAGIKTDLAVRLSSNFIDKVL